jgi:hypothetical protein
MTHLCLFGVYEGKQHCCAFMTNNDDSFVSHLIHEHYDNEHAMNWLNDDETLGQLIQEEGTHSFSSVKESKN